MEVIMIEKETFTALKVIKLPVVLNFISQKKVIQNN